MKYGKRLKMYFLEYRRGFILCLAEAIVFFLLLYSIDIAGDILFYFLFLHFLLWMVVFLSSFRKYCKQNRDWENMLDGRLFFHWETPVRYGKGTSVLETAEAMIIEQNHRIREHEVQMQKKVEKQQEYYGLWVHQMKTPIFALELLLRSLDGTAESAKMKAELLKIKDYSQLALQYIRMDTIASDLEFKKLSVYELVKKQVKKYGILFFNQKIRLDLQEFALDVTSDEKWLSFVLGQILTNALKYTPAGGVITISAKEQELWIRDSGIGIRKEDIPNLFRKSFTGNNGRLNKEASGMGLYLSGKVMDTLGYRIALESEQGKGTTVKLMFSEASLKDY